MATRQAITLSLTETEAWVVVIELQKRAAQLEQAASNTPSPHNQAVCQAKADLLNKVATAIQKGGELDGSPNG